MAKQRARRAADGDDAPSKRVPTPAGLDLGDRIRRWRLERGLSQRGLSAAADFRDGSFVSRLERGLHPRPSADSVRRLAAALGVPEEALLPNRQADDAGAGGGGRPTVRAPAEMAHELWRQLAAASPVPVPVSRQRVGAGASGTVDIEYVWYMLKPGERQEHVAATIVAGECLEPDIRPGQIVIYHTDGSPRVDWYVVAEVDGDTVVKILRREADGSLWLVAHRDWDPVPAERPGVRVIGPVLEVHFVPPRPSPS